MIPLWQPLKAENPIEWHGTIYSNVFGDWGCPIRADSRMGFSRDVWHSDKIWWAARVIKTAEFFTPKNDQHISIFIQYIYCHDFNSNFDIIYSNRISNNTIVQYVFEDIPLLSYSFIHVRELATHNSIWHLSLPSKQKNHIVRCRRGSK